jgi:putative transposase
LARCNALKRYELRPNGEQERNMGRFAGSRRFVYNKGLALQRAHYEAGGTFTGYVAMAKLLTEWRHSAQTPWLKDAPVHPLQHALKDLERACRNFFDQRGSFPRFKRKGRSESFRYPDSKQFQVHQVNSRIKLPKARLGTISQQPESVGCPQEHHFERIGRQMRQHPDHARG